MIDDPDGGSSVNLATRTATIDLDAGEAIYVTFTNCVRNGKGSITVVKDTVANALQDFTFTRNFGPDFQLDDDLGVQGGDDALPNSRAFANLPPGTYTVTELAQTGYTLANLVINDPDGGSFFNLATRTATIDLDDGENITVTFVNRGNSIVVTPDKGSGSQPFVHILDAATGEVLTRFLAYEQSYRGGVRVAAGDLNGDGIDEIITAPGRSSAPRVKVFDQQGNLLHSFLAYPGSFKGGVDVAVGDVNGDGRADIATAMTYNGNQVKVFKNAASGSLAFAAFSAFNPFGTFKGGATVKVASLGTASKVNGAVKFNNNVDARAEIVVASGSGLRSTVKVFAYTGSSNAAAVVRTFLPFTAGFKGGITLDVARINGDLVPDIVVAAGNGGDSHVRVLNGINGAALAGFTAFNPPADASYNAPVHVAAADETGDGIADFIYAAQGTDGATRKIRKFTAISAEVVDEIMSHPDFSGAHYLATL